MNSLLTGHVGAASAAQITTVISTEGRDLHQLRRSLTFVRDDNQFYKFAAKAAPAANL